MIAQAGGRCGLDAFSGRVMLACGTGNRRSGGMAIDKIVPTLEAAVAGVTDGMTIIISGFGFAGVPNDLIHAVLDLGATDITVISNNAGTGTEGLAALMGSGRVKRIICSYPRSRGSDNFDARYAAGQIELELVPQGTLSERMRAAAAGIGARSEEHTSELQSLMRISYAVFCLKKKHNKLHAT